MVFLVGPGYPSLKSDETSLSCSGSRTLFHSSCTFIFVLKLELVYYYYNYFKDYHSIDSLIIAYKKIYYVQEIVTHFI